MVHWYSDNTKLESDAGYWKRLRWETYQWQERLQLYCRL